jgi:hypothetical protein
MTSVVTDPTKMEERPYGLCDSCGQVDKAPKHLIYGSRGDFPLSPELATKAVKGCPKDYSVESLMAEVQDTSTSQKHMDCCVADGCPDQACNHIHDRSPAPADKPLQNEELFKHIRDSKSNVGDIGVFLNDQRLQEAEEAKQPELAASGNEGSDK